jgi:WD40 repeat protein
MTGKFLRKIETGVGSYGITFSPDGKTLATYGHADAVVFWDVETGKEQDRFEIADTQYLEQAVFAAKGRLIASSSFHPDKENLEGDVAQNRGTGTRSTV